MNVHKIQITEEEYKAAVKAERATKNKNVSRRLKAIILSYEGLKNREISEELGYNPTYITKILCNFKSEGLEYFISNKQKGNNRYLSREREKEILDSFTERTSRGEVVTVKEIKERFDKEIGKETPSNFIYRLLKRHKWRNLPQRWRLLKTPEEMDTNS